MPEARSLAIGPARATWRGWLSSAQRLQQLTQTRASACERLMASLLRWPSFAAADPWAIRAQMPAGPEAAEGQRPMKRSYPSREALSPAATARAARGLSPHAVAAPGRHPGVPSPMRSALRRGSALTTQPPPSRAETAESAESAECAKCADLTTAASGALAPRTAVEPAVRAGSVIAALVTEAIGRHVAGVALGDTAASPSPWNALLPAEAAPKPAATATSTPPLATPGDSRPALQAVDLPMRAALGRIAESEVPAPAAALLAPAGDLLQRLLPREIGTPSTTPAPEAAAAQRVAAPRAASRLLSEPGRSVAAPAITHRPDGPSADRIDDGGSEDSADTISRQLADQAWLRGVDFT